MDASSLFAAKQIHLQVQIKDPNLHYLFGRFTSSTQTNRGSVLFYMTEVIVTQKLQLS